MSPPSAQTLFILGMHRSGTSCLAGMLEQTGTFLGQVNQQARFNPKGNRENPRITQLNDQVLSFNNASWRTPPHPPLSWNRSHSAQRDQIIASYAEQPRWGFKDPRTLLTLDFWLDGLEPAQVASIGTFRHPLAVALSLSARNPGNQIEQSIALWCHYNSQLLRHQAQHPFPLLDFDLEPDAYRAAFGIALEQLGSQRRTASTEPGFFDQALRNQTRPSEAQMKQYRQLLAPAMPLYQRLREQRTG
ncbi:MAG: hypothetical protein K9L82_14585 [Chromatiaceae bacterium]|nr:hypothetical protein [Chromatiaceae bacterium]MCF7995294.1 hypothetical protein [Chromatiaceae bacterium]MCF8016512.1 hypothetical protein [Chromatiaceae bacterium]